MPIEETEWEACRKVCNFLKVAAKITEAESGTSSVTMSVAIKASDNLLRGWGKESTLYSSTLKDVAKLMLTKLQKYGALVHFSIANIARIIDRRFLIDIIRGSDVLRSFILVFQSEDFDRCSEDTVQARSLHDKL